MSFVMVALHCGNGDYVRRTCIVHMYNTHKIDTYKTI